MITAVVRFALPKGTTAEEAKALFERSVPAFRGAPGLVRKYYLYGEGPVGGGVYLWESREAAERLYTPQWRQGVADRYGTQPEILFFETPVIVDNSAEAVA